MHEIRYRFTKEGKPSSSARFRSPRAVRLLKSPLVFHRGYCFCPQFCFRLMANSASTRDEERNGFGSTVDEWIVFGRFSSRGKKEDERKKTAGREEEGRREERREEQRSESLPHHFSQQTKTFAWISIWSCEAVFPSCPAIHHLSLHLLHVFTSGPGLRRAERF